MSHRHLGWIVAALAIGLVAASSDARRAHRTPKTFPFPRSSHERRPGRRDALEKFWADGLRCSVGCRPRGARPGWPLRPFHRQHALRAGLNERRSSSFHHGIDIQARDRSKVYAIQPGRAHVIMASGPEERVQVGNYIYWHINRRVSEGQYVSAYKRVLGTVKKGFGHLHLSEVDSSGRYLNPLRPGGRVLKPWRDDDPPVLGRPEFRPHGRVFIKAFDPQSFTVRTTYETPVLAPAALAYRLFDSRGHKLGRLHFALRGSQNLDWSVARLVFARDARKVGFHCFERRLICRPNWHYLLAGGLAPPLQRGSLRRGRYRLTAYAWDWAGNVRARDVSFSVRRSSAHGRPAATERAPRLAPPAAVGDRG